MEDPSIEIHQRDLLGRAQLSFLRTVTMVNIPRKGNLEKKHFLLCDRRGGEEERGQLRWIPRYAGRKLRWFAFMVSI